MAAESVGVVIAESTCAMRTVLEARVPGRVVELVRRVRERRGGVDERELGAGRLLTARGVGV